MAGGGALSLHSPCCLVPVNRCDCLALWFIICNSLDPEREGEGERENV